MRTPLSPAGRALPRVVAALTVAIAAAATPALAAPDDAEPLVTRPAEKVVGDAPPPAAEASAPRSLLRRLHDRTSEMAVATMDFIGIRYRRGGSSAETGFDCSGFTRHVFEMSLGMVLPRRANEQASAPGLVAVRRDDLQPGDLVFFHTLKRSFSHVGIYLGANRFIHAPRTGASIRTDDMTFAYWAKRYDGARRPATDVALTPKPAEPAAPQTTSAGGE